MADLSHIRVAAIATDGVEEAAGEVHERGVLPVVPVEAAARDLRAEDRRSEHEQRHGGEGELGTGGAHGARTLGSSRDGCRAGVRTLLLPIWRRPPLDNEQLCRRN